MISLDIVDQCIREMRKATNPPLDRLRILLSRDVLAKIELEAFRQDEHRGRVSSHLPSGQVAIYYGLPVFIVPGDKTIKVQQMAEGVPLNFGLTLETVP